MNKPMRLCLVMLFGLVLSGCAHFQSITPEQAIVRAIAVNNVVAQCYAEYQKELDALNAIAIEQEAGLMPVNEYIAEAPSRPYSTE